MEIEWFLKPIANETTKRILGIIGEYIYNVEKFTTLKDSMNTFVTDVLLNCYIGCDLGLVFGSSYLRLKV